MLLPDKVRGIVLHHGRPAYIVVRSGPKLHTLGDLFDKPFLASQIVGKQVDNIRLQSSVVSGPERSLASNAPDELPASSLLTRVLFLVLHDHGRGLLRDEPETGGRLWIVKPLAQILDTQSIGRDVLVHAGEVITEDAGVVQIEV